MHNLSDICAAHIITFEVVVDGAAEEGGLSVNVL